MAQTATHTRSTARAASLARRRAMSTGGKTNMTLSSSENRAEPIPSVDQIRPSSATLIQSSARSVSMARRQALASQGKSGASGRDRTRGVKTSVDKAIEIAQAVAAKRAAEASRTDGGCSCKQQTAGDWAADSDQIEFTGSAPDNTGSTARLRAITRKPTPQSVGRTASLARRNQMAARGKAGLLSQGLVPEQAMRAANPQLSSRDLARALREQRSRKGNTGKKVAASAGRMRQRPATAEADATDAPWKAVISETAQGQIVTGTQVGRSRKVSGDEASTCRKVTGTEYMAADIFREFCQSDLDAAPSRSGLSETARGITISGNKLGRSTRVTGNEPGSCKRVTGNEYVGAEQLAAFCGTKPTPGATRITGAETRKGKTISGNNVGRSDRVTGDETGSARELTGTQYMQTSQGKGEAPAKVRRSQTLRGGSLTGTAIGRSERVTGDEPGSCRHITGDDYIGQEQFKNFCGTRPEPQDQKVGQSRTLRGEAVTGTLTGRSSRVTGDEPGSCKSITGTPYAGMEQYQAFCKPEQAQQAQARIHPIRSTGAVLTGLQPGIGGRMTGNDKGVCEPLTGTPYVGADQYAEVCPAQPAQPGQADFPQPLANAPWGQFSVGATVAPMTPANSTGVTGTRYEQGRITGPFGKAGGRVTGTEEFRFGRGKAQDATPPQVILSQPTAPARITGEGMAAGKKITGDDWERGDRVTGTEGASAVRRNPTRRGAAMAQPALPARPESDTEMPVSRVTGSSGNTDKGALVTYSGGARG